METFSVLGSGRIRRTLSVAQPTSRRDAEPRVFALCGRRFALVKPDDGEETERDRARQKLLDQYAWAAAFQHEHPEPPRIKKKSQG